MFRGRVRERVCVSDILTSTSWLIIWLDWQKCPHNDNFSTMIEKSKCTTTLIKCVLVLYWYFIPVYVYQLLIQSKDTVKVKLFCHGWVGLHSLCFAVTHGPLKSLQSIVVPLPVWTWPSQNVLLKHRRATSPLHKGSTWPWEEDATQLSQQTKAASVGTCLWRL